MMRDINTVPANRKRLKILVWILFPFFLLIPIVIGITTDTFPIYNLISLVLGIICLVTIIFISDNYHNWPLVLFIFFYVGLFFKKQHWPFAGLIISTSVFILTIVSLVIIFRFLFKNRQNQFIRWFGISTLLITTTYMTGWVFMIQHWDINIGLFLGYTGCIIMIITFLAMVFTLPNSNYIGWSALERKTFYRVVLIPMVFLFFIMTFGLVFTKAYETFMDFNSIRWSLDGIKLLDLEGIPKL